MTNSKVAAGLVVAVMIGGITGCARLRGGGTPKTEDEKTLYALGLIIARNLAGFSLSPRDLDLVKAGMSDGLTKGTKPLVDLETYGPKVDGLSRSRQTARAAAEKEGGKRELDKAAREAGARKTASGLIIRTVKPGTGPTPAPEARVNVHYEGRLLDGTVFDSSRKRNQVATFPLNGVIKCWTEGLGMMKVGEKAVLTCPADIAYGDGGRPPTIPGGATLVFDVELVSIAQ
jgi:FKBP-type peptidyl-prolyl cis-trans isomerase FkpA